MDETRLAIFLQIGVLVLGTGFILLFGQRWSWLRDFRACMLAQWKPALGISLLFLLGMGLGGRGLLNPYALAIFCEALLGLALARGIPQFEPLPLTEALVTRRGRLPTALDGLLFALLA